VKGRSPYTGDPGSVEATPCGCPLAGPPGEAKAAAGKAGGFFTPSGT